MNKTLIVVLSLSLCACTSYYPVIAESGDIQTEIRAGDILRTGDRIRVNTGETEPYDLVISQMTDDTIIGENASVDIDQITELNIRKTSAAKTTFLVIGIVLVVGGYYTAKGLEDAFGGLFAPSM